MEKLAHGVSGEVVLGRKGPVVGASSKPASPCPMHAPPHTLSLAPCPLSEKSQLLKQIPNVLSLSLGKQRCQAHRKHGRRGRHVPLGLGGGGTVGFQEGQVTAAKAALLDDATAAAGHTACGPAWKTHRTNAEVSSRQEPHPPEKAAGETAPVLRLGLDRHLVTLWGRGREARVGQAEEPRKER